MDYNDNDYEGQNLHLTGEESSKVSVLRPFALPKFDFDDSLHGHLRFDSLVENEVFLGIPSQEDNHWIEDFSRGGSGIEFSSSAAESCALPRHINVWSEATSSESVEMLLKAVGQEEEMVPGENIVEESDPGDQLTGQMENNLRQDLKVDDAGNLSVSPAEVGESFSKLNQSAGEDVRAEHTLQAQETSSGADANNKDDSLTITIENSNLSMEGANNNQLKTCGSVDESLSSQMQESVSIPGEEIDNTENASQNIDVSVREPDNQEKISDISCLSSSHKENGISDPDDQEESCNENDQKLTGITFDTDNIKKDCTHGSPPELHSLKEDRAVETSIINSGEASSIGEMGKSISTGDGCNKIAFALEPADCIQHSTVSGTEGMQLSESLSILHEKPLQGEGVEGIGIKTIDVVTSPLYDDKATKQVGVIISPDERESCVGNYDISPNSNSSLEAPRATSESSLLHRELHSPSKRGGDYNTDHTEDVPGNSTVSTVSSECCGEKSTEDMKDAVYTAAIQKENLVDEDHVTPPLVAGSMKTCTEYIAPMQVDAPESNQDVLARVKEDEGIPYDSGNMECDDIEKEVRSVCPAEGGTVEKTTGLQSDISTMDYPVLNTDVEDTKLMAPCVEGDVLVDSHEHNPPPRDLGHVDQSKENEVEASKQPSPLVPKEAFESNVLAPAIETEKGTMPASAAGDMNTSNQSVSLLETSSVTMPNEASKKLKKKMVHSADLSIVQEAGAESPPTKKPVEAETERNLETNSSALSVSSCTVEIAKSNKEPIPDASCPDLSQSQPNKQAPLTNNNGENIGDVLTTSEVSGVNNDPSKEEGTFTFDIKHLGSQSTEGSGKDLQTFPRLQAFKLPLTGEGFLSVSSSSQMVVEESSHVSPSTPGVCPPSGSLRSPSERKSRRGGSKSGKGSSKKGNLVKENFPLKQTEKGDKSSPLLSSSGTGHLMTFESGVKPRGAVSIPTSNLPDLNTSAPSSVFFQQPFTDLQQVQLRAQIFVYGSLIQGAAPDEACMVSAFDGGRSVWERSWRACVDKLHGQKSQGNNAGTPVPSRSGVKAPDQINRQGFLQSEMLSSSAVRASNKTIASPVVNPLIPPSSPLWSGETLPPSSMGRGAVIDYQAAVSPLNPFQTPPMRNYVAHTTWLSQAQAPPPHFPVPWLSSSQTSPFEISTSYPTFPNTDGVKKTAVKESSLPIASGAKHVTPIPAPHTGSSTILPVPYSLDSKKVKVSTDQTADTKTRKRKKSSSTEDVGQTSVVSSLLETVSAHAVTNQLSNKAPAVENLGQISLITQNQVDSMTSPVVGSYFSTSVAVTSPSCFLPKGNTDQAISVVLPPFSSGDLNKGGFLSTDKKALKFEGFSEVEEAKLQAQEAATHAAAAISHCEGVWSQLHQQKSSGLTSDAESKLASAAVAIAAAAAVAKAAAAAAKIASNAAVQAKQMADEAVTISNDSNLVYNSRNLLNASPAISAAKEAARKRIEAASAATRHAENLDAIVKAAELAAEAVAHAGKVVAMGDPFSLSALAGAGPNNYWKVPEVASLPGSTSVDLNKNKSVSNNAGEVPNVSSQHKEPVKDMRVTSHAVNPIEAELSRNEGGPVTLEEDLITSVKHGDDRSKSYNDKNVSDSAKTAFVSDMEMESRSLFLTTSIKEGSHVEVLKDHDDLKKAWFSANVLSLKDGVALVCYDGLQSDEGSEQLKEWVSLEAKDGNVPKVRIPHPMTTVLFEGTRKRRRAAVKDYAWSVGDRVDAWVRDCWCEGIVAEKNEKDATALSIHFPAKEETLNVKMWHLRPSLVWSDGEWIEWSKPRQEDGNSQGDTPVEKRPKLGSTSAEVKGKAKMAKNIDFEQVERNEEPKLPLSANENVFNIGSTREVNKTNTGRTIKSGLGREGSRGVVFGVPKPGKKRKFMEVSKHYVSDRTAKSNVPSDSVKLSKFLMPLGSGPRGFRNSSNQEKQPADSKPRTGKPPGIPTKTLLRKDNSTSSRPTAVSEHSAKGSISNDENESSDIGEASESSMVFSSQVLPLKKAVRNARSDRLNQGRLAPVRGKSTKDEAADRLASEVSEPRRSNRRIQPTSRLLEGLQSSLIISKVPSSSHDKGHRNVNKSSNAAVRGNNNRG